MSKTIALILSLIIILSTIISLVPKVSSQQDKTPKDPYFVGAGYSLNDRLLVRNVTASIFIPDGPPEYYPYSINYLHYYVLLNVNNYDPNNPRYPRYWYQFGFDNKFNVIAAIYDRGNNRTSDRDDVVWWCDTYPLSRGVWYRFTIHMLDNGNVVFLIERFILGDWRTIYSCPRSYSTSNRLVLDYGYSVFEEVRANQGYERMPYYSFHFANLGSNERPIETNWVSFKGSNNSTINPVPPNTQATIYRNYVLIQNFYNRAVESTPALPNDGASATGTPSKNTFMIAYRANTNQIVIAKVTYKDMNPNTDYSDKYWYWYEHVITLSERTIKPPSIVYNFNTGRYYLAWRGLDDKLNVMQSFDGRTWFNKVTLNEKSYHGPTLTVGDDGYIYLVWVGLDDRINVMRSQDGINWYDKSIYDEKSKYHVGAVYAGNNLIISWVGLDYKINVIKYSPSSRTWYGKITLNEYAYSGLSMTVIRDPYKEGWRIIYLVWKGGGGWINSLRSDDLGTNWGYKMIFDESLTLNPFIASNQDKLFITNSEAIHIFLLRTTL
jgi:hypothetical protein